MNNSSNTGLPAKRRLVLHIGTHKTGTTSIQRLCWNYREKLLEFGWLYAVSGRPKKPIRPGHHNLSFQLVQGPIEKRQDWAKQLDFSDIKKEWENLMAEISGYPEKNVVLSSEAIAACNKEYIQLIKDYVSDFDVTIVVYLRNQLDYLLSAYKQRVKSSGYTSGFSEFIQKRAKSNSHVQMLDRWASIFGKKSLNIRIYDKVTRSSGVQLDFFKILGLQDTAIQSLPLDFRVNVSPSDDAIILIRKINFMINKINHIFSPKLKIKPIKYGQRLGQRLSAIAHIGMTKQKIVREEDIVFIHDALLQSNAELFSKYIRVEDQKFLNV